jgi:type I restriction enzyme M protein
VQRSEAGPQVRYPARFGTAAFFFERMGGAAGLKRLKKANTDAAATQTIDAQIREQEKEARDLEVQAASIDAFVFDLKAVNPNAVMPVDERTPAEIIQSIEDQSRIVSQALTRLSMLIS